MTEPIDYGTVRGLADEKHWTDFTLTTGDGELVAPRVQRPGVKNADYMFPRANVIVELKVLETEMAHTAEMLHKVDALIAKYPGVDPDDQQQPLYFELFDLLRAPLQRVIKKANRQIKETKSELQLQSWRGVTVVVNDGFRSVSPGLAITLFSDILAGSSYKNTDAFIYQTNHLVELSETQYAVFLWSPLYRNTAETPELVNFVNDLGRRWRRYVQAIEPQDVDLETEYLDLSKAEVVTGSYRKHQFVGEDIADRKLSTRSSD